MPEYLAPGVFIEEIPARLKAIEGVSTSTAGFAGQCERGSVPGFPLPFNGATQNFLVPRDPAPTLVTSFADYTRQFGGPLPLPDPNHTAHLTRAVKGFFDNGGKRLYIARVVDITNPTTLASTATRGFVQLAQGTRLRLARRAPSGATTITLTSLRRVADGANIRFLQRNNNSVVFGTTVASFDTARNEVTLAGAPGSNLEPNEILVEIAGAAPTANGPRFHARSPGAWSSQLTVLISNADRGPVRTGAAPVGSTQIPVQFTGSFYRGAIVELTDGTAREYNEVLDILPGNFLRLAAATTTVVLTGAATHFARVIEIDVTIADESGAEPVVETFRGLTWNQRNEPDTRRRHYATVVNASSRLVYVQPPGVGGLAGSEAASLDTQPINANGFPTPITTAGGDGNTPSDDDYAGVNNGPGNRTGIESLQDIDDVRIIAAPGRFGAVVHNALITQCERLRYRFAILDSNPTSTNVNTVLADRNIYDSSFAAFYTPWLEVLEEGQRLELPPSGHVAGIYARTDIERGVYKAPANEVVRGIVGLQTYITTGEQEILNPRGVNCIRRFEGRGLRVWGARTLSSDPEFRYINVRRFLIFLEASIDRGTQYVVFEPNSPPTWARVVDSVTAFLHTQWRDGALFGRKPEDAFFVRCDETTMSVDDIQNGRLICLIGVAIVRPAEFVIFRIQQITGFGNE